MASGFGYIPVTRLPVIPPTPPPPPSVQGPGSGSRGASNFQDHVGKDRNERGAGSESGGTSAAGATSRTSSIQATQTDGFRLERTTRSTRIDRDARPMQSERNSLRSLPSRWENFRTKVHDLMKQPGGASQEDLFLLQMEMNEISFQVETASKVVEHATSGTKTVLQTQA